MSEALKPSTAADFRQFLKKKIKVKTFQLPDSGLIVKLGFKKISAFKARKVLLLAAEDISGQDRDAGLAKMGSLIQEVSIDPKIIFNREASEDEISGEDLDQIDIDFIFGKIMKGGAEDDNADSFRAERTSPDAALPLQNVQPETVPDDGFVGG